MQIRHPLADHHRPRLLITGASTRAAAWSAIRAGFFPVCADRFADEDLRQIAEVHEFQQMNVEFRAAKPTIVTTSRLHVSDWRFNPKDLSRGRAETSRLKRLNKYLGPVLGPDPRVSMKGCQTLPRSLRIAGLPFLAEQLGTSELLNVTVRSDSTVKPYVPPVANGSWIEKPLWGGGGYRIRLWDAKAAAEDIAREPTYFQEYRAGKPMSAIFVANPRATPSVELIGITEQIIGDTTAAASPTQFTYCGNIAPVTLPVEATQTVQKIGVVLADKLDQCGIFGIDFIWDGTTPWVIEINPRYTAACELLELASGRALLRDHWQAWLPNEPLPTVEEVPPKVRTGVIGKLILYARSPVTAPDFARFLRHRSEWTVPFLADIPRGGTSFSPGDPLCTVFATGRNAADCRRKLARRARRIRNWFGDLTDPVPEPS